MNGGDNSRLTPSAVTSGRVPLSGAAHSVALAFSRPGLVQLTTPVPLVARLRPEGGLERVEVYPAGAHLRLWLPTGAGSVDLRAIGEASLWGSLAVTHSEAIAIGEGLGPEVLVPPGGSRVFSFVTTEAGAVGLGVNADADRVVATLYDATGTPLGTGLVQMPDLPAGTWLLALSLPADSAPVWARAGVAGVDRDLMVDGGPCGARPVRNDHGERGHARRVHRPEVQEKRNREKRDDQNVRGRLVEVAAQLPAGDGEDGRARGRAVGPCATSRSRARRKDARRAAARPPASRGAAVRR